MSRTGNRSARCQITSESWRALCSDPSAMRGGTVASYNGPRSSGAQSSRRMRPSRGRDLDQAELRVVGLLADELGVDRDERQPRRLGEQDSTLSSVAPRSARSIPSPFQSSAARERLGYYRGGAARGNSLRVVLDFRVRRNSVASPWTGAAARVEIPASRLVFVALSRDRAVATLGSTDPVDDAALIVAVRRSGSRFVWTLLRAFQHESASSKRAAALLGTDTLFNVLSCRLDRWYWARPTHTSTR